LRFWDSSGIVPLLIAQAQSARAQGLFHSDNEMVVWWAARVECASAIARLEREGAANASSAAQAFKRLQELAKSWDEVQPTDRLRTRAERLLRVHRLRAADALQLAAMLEVSTETPLASEIVCFDDRLAEAISREGLRLSP
jgi:predicted nucleic acid-binding protein